MVNTIFGDLQHQLLQDLLSHSPLTGFQQFLNTLRVGTIAPLTLVHPLRQRHAGLHGDGAGHGDDEPLQVSYVPGKGYDVWGRSGRGKHTGGHDFANAVGPGGRGGCHTVAVIPCAPFPRPPPIENPVVRGSAAITRWRCIWRTHRGGHSPPDCNAWVAIHWPRISSRHWRDGRIARVVFARYNGENDWNTDADGTERSAPIQGLTTSKTQ